MDAPQDEPPDAVQSVDYSHIPTTIRNRKRTTVLDGINGADVRIGESKQVARLAQQRRSAEAALWAIRLVLVVLVVMMVMVQVGGLFLFTRGFLLSRRELDDRSECAVLPGEMDETTGRPGCWMDKQFDRAVVIVVDALRYDFVVPSSEGGRAGQYRDKLPFLFDTAVSNPANALLRPFIADPPTTTMQRLKALMSGTLPTFVDAGSNFASSAITEDNLIGQLRTANKTIVQLGDDTWQSLFPDAFDGNLSVPAESFNVWDLDTVDRTVTTALFPLLQPDRRDWDVLIGHYLGVDHAGHRFGPDHRQMGVKLAEMNDVIAAVTRMIDDDTLLIVIGDHGMDSKGDHGGESADEVESVLWMYSSRPVFGRVGDDDPPRPPTTAADRPVSQIDLVPTMALALGLPVPFSNIGSLVPELFAGSDGRLALARRLVAGQVRRYALRSGLWSDELARLWETVDQSAAEIVDRVQAAGRAEWARFDMPAIAAGLVVMAVGVAMLVRVGTVVSCGVVGLAACQSATMWGALAGLAGQLAGLLSIRFGTGVLGKPIVGAVLGSALCASAAVFVHLRRVSSSSSSSSSSGRTVGWASLAVLAGWWTSLGSNSFVVWERDVVHSGLMTVLAICAIATIHSEPDDSIRIRRLGALAAIGLLNRVSRLSVLCREDQSPDCLSTFYPDASGKWGIIAYAAIPIVVAAVMPMVVRTAVVWIGRSTGVVRRTWHDYPISISIWFRVLFPISVAMGGVYWLIDAVESADLVPVIVGSSETIQQIKTAIAQIGLTISVVGGSSAVVLSRSTSPSPSLPVERHLVVLSAVFSVLSLISKPAGSGMLAVTFCQLLMLPLTQSPSLFYSSHANTVGRLSALTIGIFLSASTFYSTGHAMSISHLQWDSAFVGLSSISFPWSQLMVIANTFSGQIMTAVAIPALPLVSLAFYPLPTSRPTSTSTVTIRQIGSHGYEARLVTILSIVSTGCLFFAIVAATGLSSAVIAAILRRHLMVFRVFCPRFLFGAGESVVVGVVLTCSIILSCSVL